MSVKFRRPRKEDRDWMWNATTETVWQDMPPSERLSVERKDWEDHFRREAEALLDSRVTETWVAEDEEGSRLGYVIMGHTTGMFSPIEFGFLYDIYVDPAHRREGVGRSLIARTEEYCAKRGLGLLRLEVSSDNWPAVTMYNRLGFRPERIVMVKNLGGETAEPTDGASGVGNAC